MVVAVVLAGGRGSRFGDTVPKQFIQVNGVPILAYTLEKFEKNPLVDAIEVVSIAEWKEEVWGYKDTFHITKLRWVVEGGDTVSESIRNGIYFLEGICSSDDIVIIHDSVRPLLNQQVLTELITVCRIYGNAVSSLPCLEHVALTSDGSSTNHYIPKEECRRILTPQAYRYDVVDQKYHEAFDMQVGIFGSAYANSMMIDLGLRLYFVDDTNSNIKITTPEDLAYFKFILDRGNS